MSADTTGQDTTEKTGIRLSVFLAPFYAAFLGAILALILANLSGGVWNSLHAAYGGNLQYTTVLAGFVVPIAALLAIGARTAAVSASFGSLHWLRLWLTVAPAGHWLAATTLLLYASRYTPPGGKIVPILIACAHLVLFCIAASLLIRHWRNGRAERNLAIAYVAGLAITILLAFTIGFGFRGHVAALTLSLVAAAVVASAAAAYRKLKGMPVGERFVPSPLGRDDLFLEVSGVVLAALALAAYLLTSQFDRTPTSALTHAALVLVALAYVVAAGSVAARSEAARWLFRLGGPALLGIALLVLVVLHYDGESDPITVVTVVLAPTVALCGVAALRDRPPKLPRPD